jgi:hypothetical protein
MNLAFNPSKMPETETDESNFSNVLRCVLELPGAAIKSKRSTEGTLALEVDSNLGPSFVIATSNRIFDFPSDRPTIVVAWNSAYPLPFMVNPSHNITFFDLKYGLTSLKLSRLALYLRGQFEARGYRFTHFDSPPRRSSVIRRAVLFGRRKVLSRVKRN